MAIKKKFFLFLSKGMCFFASILWVLFKIKTNDFLNNVYIRIKYYFLIEKK